MATQALRAWLLSACPSGTKAIAQRSVSNYLSACAGTAQPGSTCELHYIPRSLLELNQLRGVVRQGEGNAPMIYRCRKP
jgi:hypothetical protein